MKKRTIYFFGIILLIVLVLVGYRLYVNDKKDKSEGGKGEGPKKGAKVYGKVIGGSSFDDFLSLSGSIEANEIVELHAEVSGIIESINFSEGGYVSAGQTLVKINDADLRAQLSQAKTKAQLSRENERRAKLLLEKEAISQEEYDIASADYRTAESQIQLIHAQLNKTIVKAPFSGTIGLRNISKGSYITPTVSIAKLANTSQVKVLFSIPERYANMVNRNTLIEFSVQGSSDKYSAKVFATEPNIEENTRTLLVKALAVNNTKKLLPGTFVSVNFPLEKVENAILVPAEALIPIQNGKKVFIQKNGKAKEIIVETGGRTDDDVLVTKGLAIGDTILTSGMMSLRDGSPVKVILK